MNLSTEAAIDLIIGPMYSGKSTELIRRLNIYHEMNMKVLYINSKLDTRSRKEFSTHNSVIGSLPFPTIKIGQLGECDITNFDVIGVDEGQLFTDLKIVVIKWVEGLDKIVVVAGLNGDFTRRSFGQINDLIPFCDNVTKLYPFCVPCRRKTGQVKAAHFTKRMVADNRTVLIGDKEMYLPTCRKCFF